jgi:hypothetical protein
MADTEGAPRHDEIEALQADTDEVLNPFEGNQPVGHQYSPLELGGGGILPISGVSKPNSTGDEEVPTHEARTIGEVEKDVSLAAKKACGLIAAMFVEESDPDKIVFPVCSDLSVIDSALQQLGNTPLGLGYGKFPESVPKAWARFLKETTDHYRKQKGLETADLAPLVIRLPEWLKTTPTFDILEDCTLMNVVIAGEVDSVIGRRLSNSRVRFDDNILDGARIGNESQRCTFVVRKNMAASESFVGAENISLKIEGHHRRGDIGPVSNSSIVCDGDWAEGVVINKRNSTDLSPGVTSRYAS